MLYLTKEQKEYIRSTAFENRVTMSSWVIKKLRFLDPKGLGSKDLESKAKKLKRLETDKIFEDYDKKIIEIDKRLSPQEKTTPSTAGIKKGEE